MPPDYEALLQLLQRRRSIRRFRPDPLPPGTLEKLAEAARWAPSAGNRQAWRLLAVEGEARRQRLAEAVGRVVARLKAEAREDALEPLSRYLDHFTHFGAAPLVLVPIYRPGTDLLAQAVGAPVGEQDPARDALASVAAAIENLLLAAEALGLGACWMTGPLVAAGELGAQLEVPQGWRIAALIPVGLAAETPPPAPRRDLDRLLQRVD